MTAGSVKRHAGTGSARRTATVESEGNRTGFRRSEKCVATSAASQIRYAGHRVGALSRVSA